MNVNNITPISGSSKAAPIESMPPPNKNNENKTINKAQHLESSKNVNDQKDRFSVEEAHEMVELLNEYMDGFQTNLGFSIRKELGNQVVVEIKNRDTHELIKQIPAEELLAIKEKMEELTGLLLDHSV